MLLIGAFELNSDPYLIHSLVVQTQTSRNTGQDYYISMKITGNNYSTGLLKIRILKKKKICLLNLGLLALAASEW